MSRTKFSVFGKLAIIQEIEYGQIGLKDATRLI